MKTKDILVRYSISTLGLAMAAFGVSLSIKANLGIAPLSCVPTVLNLNFEHISVGTFTWGFNLLFILLQAVILKKDFGWKHVMQVIPIVIFGYLLDLFIWMMDAINAPSANYIVQMSLCMISIVLTAIGIRVEVAGQGWILPIDSSIYIISSRSKLKFGTVKVLLDVSMVIITAVLALVFFGMLTGNGHTVVIREGTVLQALLTGICMRFTDPVVDRICALAVPPAAKQ